ncbi:hypothetical protein BC962_1759 [Gillisia mitskevichiae]|uniref:Uncharacterized protein n=1 Tax=Gillisia mitskevichiae TaxID=270921 RepID=A0A495PTI1_9FLAO|nr:hypothetical protein [Gillisia mitskevichiae]RKS53507.1 hypothetical protein BC962_1759 [Gillisia mitskevichiae]
MNNLAENNTPTKKIYKDRAIWIGSFVGGPLIAGYFIAENYKALNEPENAKLTWTYTIPSIIFIFSLALLLARFENFPALVIPLAYTTGAYLFSKYYQGPGIQAHLEAGGEEFGWGRIIGISLLGLVLTFVMMFVFLLIISGLGILPV